MFENCMGLKDFMRFWQIYPLNVCHNLDQNKYKFLNIVQRGFNSVIGMNMNKC